MEDIYVALLDERGNATCSDCGRRVLITRPLAISIPHCATDDEAQRYLDFLNELARGMKLEESPQKAIEKLGLKVVCTECIVRYLKDEAG